MHEAELLENWRLARAGETLLPIPPLAYEYGLYLEEVVYAKVTGPYSLWLVFSDGIHGEIDLEPALDRGVFLPLRDPEFFAKGKLDHEAGTIVWPNEADFAPEFLYTAVKDGVDHALSLVRNGTAAE